MHCFRYEPLGQVHVPQLLDMWGDAEVIRYTNIKTPCTAEQVKDRVTVLSSFQVFAVRMADEILGVVGCLCMDEAKHEYGFFYHFKKAYWNKGIATQAARWMLQHLTETEPNAVVYSDVVEKNVASEKILQRLGFQFVSEEENAFERDGVKMAIRLYEKR